jgi:hypothetical protein
MTYKICDNGNYPFTVSLVDNVAHVSISKETDYVPLCEIPFTTAFVGKSPLNDMTKDSGCHGTKWDGNSILLHIKDTEYTYIGATIYNFSCDSPILSYVSPVGNGDVPFPYAVDSMKRYWLLTEQTRINSIVLKKYTEDPYDFLYTRAKKVDEFEVKLVNSGFR